MEKKNLLFFIEWGVFELLFVVGLLFLLFFTLSYFKILHFSSPLSLLTPKPIANPTPDPNKFRYDFATADTLLTKYVYSTLQPAYLPTASPSSNLGITQKREVFTGNWLQNKNTFIRVQFSYAPATNISNIYKIFLTSQDFTSLLLTTPEDLSQHISQQLFTNPPGNAPWTCNKIKKGLVLECQTTISLVDGENHFVVDIQQNASVSAGLSAGICFIPQTSLLYNRKAPCRIQ